MNKFLLYLVALLLTVTQLRGQLIVTIGGNGTPGSTGDGGPAVDASLHGPKGIDVDSWGNVYFATGNRIRKIDTAGIITTVAGNGTTGSSGDGGPATAAQLYVPEDVAVDASGNLYIAEALGHKIRKVDPAGIITTIAGTGAYGFSGDGGLATAAQLYFPTSVAVDDEGSIYIMDRYNYRVRKIDAAGIITTIAGSGFGAYGGDGGLATAALISSAWGIALDGLGNLYIADGHTRIRKVKLSTGIITTVAGFGTTGFGGDGAAATAALFQGTADVAADRHGNVFIADVNNGRIRKVDAAGVVTTYAGDGFLAGVGTGGFDGDYCRATDATLFNPMGVAVDDSGNIFISDCNNWRIRKVFRGHAPAFLPGDRVNLESCGSAPISLDSLLAVAESDVYQTEIWSILSGPLHGTLTAGDTTLSAGGTVSTTGNTYAAAAGYTGLDSFTIVVTDCGAESDTITFVVRIDEMPVAASVSGPTAGCLYDSVALFASVPGGSWSSTTGNTHVSPAGFVSGISAGADAIIYTISNACGTVASEHPFTVINCATALPDPALPASPGISVFPNPVSSGNAAVILAAPFSQHILVTIRTITGKAILTFPADTNKPAQLPAELPAGVYIISASSQAGTTQCKLVVTK